ncbi:hypothetical protein ANCCAN_16858 [Ancylostoma caninum]|uniref:VWFA domain-containing protein n=1 Tax=Ancylostoma caninum TaxID=29170 RepID=A0A368G2Q1_ANCCA|nr:hypothetical protein ANCCAN_16858 [Ancylostoma caninum]
MLDFFRKDFHVSIIGIDVDKTVYSGVEHHKFFSLPSSDMRKVSENFLAMIENEAIAPWCRKEICFKFAYDTQTNDKKNIARNGCQNPDINNDHSLYESGAKILVILFGVKIGVEIKLKRLFIVGLLQTTATPPVDIMPKDFLNCSCTEQNLWLDIVFILDVSASMSHESLIEIFANMITVVTDFTFDRSEDRHVRIGIVAVADGVSFSECNITKYSEFEAALEKIEPTDEKHINLFRGFIESQRVFGHIDRKNVPDVIVIYSSSFEKGGMNDPTSIADQLKISGTQIITMAFVGTGQSKVVLGLGSIASPRMNFTTWQQRDLTGKILDGFCQGEPSTALRNHHIS